MIIKIFMPLFRYHSMRRLMCERANAAIIVLIFIMLHYHAKADPDLFGWPKPKPKPYVQKIYGTLSLGDGIGLSGSLFTRNHDLFTVRYLHEDRSLTGAPFWENSPKSHLDETGIMYGKGLKVWRFFLDGSAGAAYVNYHTDVSTTARATAGLIANIQASYAVRPWWGIGVEWYGDLNIYQSRTGLLLNIHAGLLR